MCKLKMFSRSNFKVWSQFLTAVSISLPPPKAAKNIRSIHVHCIATTVRSSMSDGLSPLTFSPELFKRLVPSQFLSQHLLSRPSVRPDSRSPHEFRELSVNTGSLSNSNGSAVVRLGQTLMTCGVRAEITAPDPFHPKQGFIVPNVEIGPICHSSLRNSPPSDTQQSIAYRLQSITRDDKFINLEDLCIEAGKAVWVLYIDIVCLSHDGSLLSAANTSMISALLNTSLPLARWDSDTETCRCVQEYSPLKVAAVPHVTEFGFFDGILLADLTEEEEALCEERLTIIMTKTHLLSISKSGGRKLGARDLAEAIDQSQGRIHKMEDIVRAMQKHRL